MRFFQIAREGKTADKSGRFITAQHIEEMAESYDTDIYGARIWLEHIRGLFPDSEFKALGDVLALKADTDKTGRRVLLAALKPLKDLVKMNKERQKIYTSIELDVDFSDTGKAYLTGLAVTDSPASTGTQALLFNATNSKPNSLFSEFFEAEFDFNDSTSVIDGAEDSPAAPSFLDKIKGMFSQQSQQIADRDEATQALFADLHNAVEYGLTELQSEMAAKDEAFSVLSEKVGTLEAQLSELNQQLDTTPADGHHTARPPATGGDVYKQTDC